FLSPQPNPFQLTLVCTRRVSPPTVAPDATTGACWETTSPVTTAPERSTIRPLNTTTSPLTRPEMVTGASKAVSDPSTVPSTVEEPWTTTRSPTVCPSGTSARPDRTTNASGPWASWAQAGVATASRARISSPTIIDRRIPIASNAASLSKLHRAVNPTPTVRTREIGAIGCAIAAARRQAQRHAPAEPGRTVEPLTTTWRAAPPFLPQPDRRPVLVGLIGPLSASTVAAARVGADPAGRRSQQGGMAMVLSSKLLRSYIPAFVASRFLAGPRPLEAPAAESFSAAVLFADVSGFPPLAEQLARRGPAGTEALSELLNAYFGRLTVLVAAHGGEVATFAGDGLLAVWPATDGDLAAATRQAGRCALAVGSALNDYEAIGGHRLSLRMGVGAGEVVALNVGGVAGSWRLLLSGAPVIQTSLAEQQATRGEVVLSPEAWMLAGPEAAGDALPGGWVRLAAVHGPPPTPERPVELPEIGGATDAYVPEVVRARLAAGQAEWLGELRRVTPLFLNLLDADPARADLLEVVQPAIAALQPILRLHEGSLKQLVVDDKGLTLIAVFGLPPLAHEDDAARAAKAALKAQAALRDLGTRCAIGVATGRAFCGAVGGDVHREYDVIGDVMNLSARLMQAASDTILCDEATQSAARSRLRFRALPAISVKGKADPIAVYCPLEPARARDRPWTIVGRDRERQLLSSRLEELWGGRSGLVLIEGEPGIGKSRLLAELLQQARARGVRSLLGAGDAVEATTPYHAWRPVFTELLDLAGVEDVEARRARVLAHAGAVPRLARLAPLLNPVLALDLPDNELTAQLTGQVRADNTRRLLVRLLRAGAAAPDGAASPLLVALDDGHWFAWASWALTAEVASQVRPLLLAITTRPLAEPLPPDYRRLRDDPASDRLPLQPLDPGDTLTLVCSRLGVPSLPERVAGLIEDRAQGNPFFSEELAYALRDTGLIRIADGRCTIAPGAGDPRAVSFPHTVPGVGAGRVARRRPPHRRAGPGGPALGEFPRHGPGGGGRADRPPAAGPGADSEGGQRRR